MNVTCPSCETVYRVDPGKVPPGGVRARCAVCSSVFAVNAGGAVPAGAPSAAAQRAPAASGAPVAAAPAAFTGNTLLHTAQRARTPPGGTLPGSTRYTVSHDGQVTFTLRSDQRGLGSSSSRSCRRSTTNTDPGCVLA